MHLASRVLKALRAKEDRGDVLRTAPVQEHVLHAVGRRRAHTEHAALPAPDDGCLLAGDGLERITEDARMVESHARDGHRLYRLHGARRIPAAPHAALEHGDIHVRLCEGHAGGYGEYVELRHVIGSLP